MTLKVSPPPPALSAGCSMRNNLTRHDGRKRRALPWRGWLAVGFTAFALTTICSRWTVRLIDYTHSTTRYEVWAEQGRVGIMVGDASMQRGVWGGMWQRKGTRWRPQRARASMTNGPIVTRVDGVIIPIWSFGVLGAIAVTGLWWFRLRRYEAGNCSTCGYALEGLTGGICPECGKETSHD